jgi:hypothetical protein
LHTQHPEISSTNLRFTAESGEEVRQHLVFGLKVEYALSSEVFTRFWGGFDIYVSVLLTPSCLLFKQ